MEFFSNLFRNRKLEYRGLAKKEYVDEYGNKMSKVFYVYECSKSKKIELDEFMVVRSEEASDVPNILEFYRFNCGSSAVADDRVPIEGNFSM